MRMQVNTSCMITSENDIVAFSAFDCSFEDDCCLTIFFLMTLPWVNDKRDLNFGQSEILVL